MYVCIPFWHNMKWQNNIKCDAKKELKTFLSHRFFREMRPHVYVFYGCIPRIVKKVTLDGLENGTTRTKNSSKRRKLPFLL